MDKYLLDVTVEDGKYTVRCDADGHLYALRHGEAWRDLRGDKLIYALAAEVQRLRERLSEGAKICFDLSCPSRQEEPDR